MPDFFKPDLGMDPNSPFARDGNGKLVRRGFWLDMSDRSLIMAMTTGIGSNISNEYKREHLLDLGREHLIDDICVQEILPPQE